MTYLSLNDSAKAYMLVLCIFSMILLLISLIAHIAQKSKKNNVSVLSFFLIASILIFSLLSQLNKVNRTKYDVLLTPTLETFNNIPYVAYIGLSLGLIFVAGFLMYTLYKNSKNKINVFSVKQALENLPTGIAFTTNDAELLLSNNIMHNLCKELTGKALQNAKTFWFDLNALQNKKNCVIKGDEPSFILKSGEVWQFSKTQCLYNDDVYFEFRATDITELYNLSENTRSVNKKLTQQQKRLKELTNIIEENAESGVALNMKINFHDNFGNLLTLTKKALRESENADETRTLIDYWGNLSSVIKDLSSDDKQSLSLEQILLFANKLCCEVVLSGELPKGEQDKTTVLLCINEMLKNAYRHAGAQKLMVDISETDGTIYLIIQNETKYKLTEIKEGGGLSSLRERIEKAGGTMCMKCDKGVSMIVELKKEAQQYV